ncbi:MAG: hypothetical protein ACC628_22065 [Pirellulaceae bacterium]
MNNPVIYWVIGGLLILFFCYLMYQFTKTWRVWHVIFMFLVFSAAIALCAYISMTLRTHSAWRTIVRQQTEQVGELRTERDSMLYGNLVQVVQLDPSIRSLNAEIGRVLMDRGRVWRECQAARPGADDSVVVTLPPTPGDAGAAPLERLKKDAIVYVFMEEEAPEEDGLPLGTKIPAHYIGEFTAAADSTATVTLRPLFPLSLLDKYMMRLPNVTWSIYETMPVDGHRFFVENPNEDPDLKHDNADEKPVFGQIDNKLLERTLLFRWMVELNSVPQPLTPEQMQLLQARYAQMLEPYQRDGKRSNEEDPPDNVRLKVKFVKKYEEDVDTAGDPLGAIQSSEDFFDQGRSEIALLRRGDKVKFKPDDIGVFPEEDGNRLINEGYVELVERIFVRSLNDYEAAFRYIAHLQVKIGEDTRAVGRDTAEVQKAIALCEAQMQSREDERAKVTEDLQKFTLEKDRITEYAVLIETQWAELRNELSELYRMNRELADELARLDREITADVDKRTLEAIQENAEGS